MIRARRIEFTMLANAEHIFRDGSQSFSMRLFLEVKRDLNARSRFEVWSVAPWNTDGTE
jgi:hypothetical protein